jgi:hypothetical protein
MKSTATSPAIVAILFLSAIVCVLALIWLPIKGIWWLYNSRTATRKQVVVAGQQWMQQVEEAFTPISEQEKAVAVTDPLVGEEEVMVVAEIDAVEPSSQEVFTPLTVENSSVIQEVPSLQQVINELSMLPKQAAKRRKVWAAICRHTNVSGGSKLRDSDLKSLATFLVSKQVPLHQIAKAVKTALAA